MTEKIHSARQFRSALAGVEAISLHSNRTFPRHAHDHFGVGVMTTGAHRSWSGIGQVEPEVGDNIMVNPGEIHDGVPIDRKPRAWRMLYLDPSLVDQVTTEECPRSVELIRPAVRDPRLRTLTLKLFSFVTASTPDVMAIEQAFLRNILYLSVHCSSSSMKAEASPCVRRALERLNDAAQDAPNLRELADLSGISRFQLLRGFAREVGMTPHAYLLQRRVGLAKISLSRGETPTEAALNAGFADQSHMTRAFVRQFGVTPARYRSAVK